MKTVAVAVMGMVVAVLLAVPAMAQESPDVEPTIVPSPTESIQPTERVTPSEVPPVVDVDDDREVRRMSLPVTGGSSVLLAAVVLLLLAAGGALLAVARRRRRA